MDQPFSLHLPLARIPRQPMACRLNASPAECAALAARFGLEALHQLSADLQVRRTGEGVEAEGRIIAHAVQACVVSGTPIATRLDQPVTLRFVPPPPASVGDIELDPADADAFLIDGDGIDLAEAVAQAMLQALDPWPRADDATLADARRLLLSEEEAEAARRRETPFSALARPTSNG